MDKYVALENHLSFKRTSVKTEDKIKDIKRYLKKFLDSLNKPLSKVKEEDVTKFINSLEFSTRTQNDIKTYLKVFIKWYYADWSLRFRNLDRICKMQKASKSYKAEDMISLEEIKKIVEAEKDMMYKTYWLVFFYGGFRPSECCNLKWSQIDFDGGAIIRLHATKTGKDFYKALPREAEHMLKEWKKYNSSEWVFPSEIREDKPIVARSICGRLKRISQKAIGRKVVPYALRHSVATILYSDDNRKDDDTANQLGHNKSMKAVYMNLDEEALKSRARKTWTKAKPMTKDERTEFEQMKKKIKLLEEGMKETKDVISKTLKAELKKLGIDKDLKKVKFIDMK